MEEGGLWSLTEELLLKVLLEAGAPAVARAATLCRRLRNAQAQLAALPAFASAACLNDDQDLDENVREAVTAAREQMPAAIDFCLVFVAGQPKGRLDAASAMFAPAPLIIQLQCTHVGCRNSDALEQVVPQCQELLPPGTAVVGCCGRGLFGVVKGSPLELDPSSSRSRGASVMLGRMPGCSVRAFAALKPPPGGGSQSKEDSLTWLGIGPASAANREETGSSSAAPPLQPDEPLSCLLFAHPAASHSLASCLAGLQATFPNLLVTGGLSSGATQLFCSRPLNQPAVAPTQLPDGNLGSPRAKSGGNNRRNNRGSDQQQQKPRYVGLLVCKQRDGSWGDRCHGVGLSCQGMQGGAPLLTRLHLVRNYGILEHPDDTGESSELLGVVGAYYGNNQDATRFLQRLAYNQAELGVWAADSKDAGSFLAAASAGHPTAVVHMLGAVQGEVVGSAGNIAALDAVMAASQQQGHMLCAEPLVLSSDGVKAALDAGVRKLAASRPAAHPLLPTPTMGLVLVSCTAKGKQMHDTVGVEAKIVHASSGQLPFAGVYCDGEIGPQILDCTAAMRLAGSEASGGNISKLQGFTTIATALGMGAA